MVHTSCVPERPASGILDAGVVVLNDQKKLAHGQGDQLPLAIALSMIPVGWDGVLEAVLIDGRSEHSEATPDVSEAGDNTTPLDWMRGVVEHAATCEQLTAI